MSGPLTTAIKLTRATVPGVYVLVGLEVAEAAGLDRAQLLHGLHIDPARLDDATTRVPVLQCARLAARVWRGTRDAALGYEFGLRLNLSAHGSVAQGLMSQATFGESLAFGLKYGALRNPLVKLSLRTDGVVAIVEAREMLPLGPLRQFAIDAVLIGLVRIGRQLSGALKPEIELHFDCPEPAHYARYRHRLPPVRFNASANQLRIPAEYLQRPMHTRDAVAARAMVRQCESELAVAGDAAETAERVRALLAQATRGYPDLGAVTQRLHLSPRTLKRRLQREGWTFLQLLDEARKRDSLRLLADGALSVAEVAQRLGYESPASFTRAFRKWTGVTPSGWREAAARG